MKTTIKEALRKAGIKGTVQTIAQRFGLFVDTFPTVESMDKHLKLVLSTLEINCVLDVGAHHGEYASQLRKLGYQGDIISFEPCSESMQILQKLADRDPKWQVCQTALGETEGTLSINIFGGTYFNSFLKPSHNLDVEVERTEEVQVQRLDALLDRYTAHIENPRIYLKVDTQGYDFHVIRGLGERLKQILALQTELSVIPFYEGSPSFTNSIATLEQLDFIPNGFFPCCRDENFCGVVEFDGFFVKRETAALIHNPAQL